MANLLPINQASERDLGRLSSSHALLGRIDSAEANPDAASVITEIEGATVRSFDGNTGELSRGGRRRDDEQ